jgi:hypothetical protein
VSYVGDPGRRDAGQWGMVRRREGTLTLSFVVLKEVVFMQLTGVEHCGALRSVTD